MILKVIIFKYNLL